MIAAASVTLRVMRTLQNLANLGFAAFVAIGLCIAPAAAENVVHPDAESVRPLQPGASVPSATVRTLEGDPIDLADLVREQGALLVFYRGGW